MLQAFHFSLWNNSTQNSVYLVVLTPITIMYVSLTPRWQYAVDLFSSYLIIHLIVFLCSSDLSPTNIRAASNRHQTCLLFWWRRTVALEIFYFKKEEGTTRSAMAYAMGCLWERSKTSRDWQGSVSLVDSSSTGINIAGNAKAWWRISHRDH